MSAAQDLDGYNDSNQYWLEQTGLQKKQFWLFILNKTNNLKSNKNIKHFTVLSLLRSRSDDPTIQHLTIHDPTIQNLNKILRFWIVDRGSRIVNFFGSCRISTFCTENYWIVGSSDRQNIFDLDRRIVENLFYLKKNFLNMPKMNLNIINGRVVH